MARMTVLDAGFYTTIQDLGRKETRAYGVPQSGAMDQLSMRYANELVGNAVEIPVIEMILKGASFLFSEPTIVSITGALCEVVLQGITHYSPCVLEIKTGDVLEIGTAQNGNFIYLAIQVGFQVDTYAGSASYYPNLLDSSKVEKGAHLPYSSSNNLKNIKAVRFNFKGSMKAFPGPEFHLLDRKQQEQLLSQSFTVSKNWNRMAFQFEEVIENVLKPIKSSPVLPGTVQLTPEGKLIILMRDAQTTGGYPRVLQLSKDSISKLSQFNVGAKVDVVIN